MVKVYVPIYILYIENCMSYRYNIFEESLLRFVDIRIRFIQVTRNNHLVVARGLFILVNSN